MVQTTLKLADVLRSRSGQIGHAKACKRWRKLARAAASWARPVAARRAVVGL